MRILEKATSAAVTRVGLAFASATALALTATGPVAAAAPVFGYGNFASSSGWGGYVATSGSFKSIVGSWTEPTVTCTSSQNLFAPWVGVDGYGSSSVEQTGVQVSCSTGKPVYSAWYEMYPKQPVYISTSKYPSAANDKFTGTVTVSGTSYHITLKDNTKGWSFSTTQSYNGENVSAEAIIESPSASYPNFTNLPFTGITVNGKTFSAYNPSGLDVGKYHPTALSGGAFSMVP
jgi:hypothetical protein